MSSCFLSYLRLTSLETGLHGLAGVRCARGERGMLAMAPSSARVSFVAVLHHSDSSRGYRVPVFLACGADHARLASHGILFENACACAQGLGQPGLLRATILGQVVFYGASTACFVEISAK